MSPMNGRAGLAGGGKSPCWATSSYRPKGGRAVPQVPLGWGQRLGSPLPIPLHQTFWEQVPITF